MDGRVVAERTRLRDGALVLAGNHGFVFRLLTSADLRALDQDRREPFGRVPTGSPALALLLLRLRKLARSTAEILLGGETGVGKEVHANLIHEVERAAGPLRRPSTAPPSPPSCWRASSSGTSAGPTRPHTGPSVA